MSGPRKRRNKEGGVAVDNKQKKTKIVKEIKVDTKKCVGCRACEVACSAFHAVPRYSSVNTARSRIMVVMDEVRDIFVPVRAGDYTQAECNGRNRYVIDGIEYDECTFCPASCPSRDAFKEPDSGLPLKCDMCESVPPLETPMCVDACTFGALTYEEREEEVFEEEQQAKLEDLEIVFESLIKKYGKKKVRSTFSRLSKG
ncbi:MAG: (4Fe-4S)-binding protein [Deltaproteobacteria bacterium]|nr:(4Fe-4S)-binding protein [Deltaproteobacteria bacterium]